MEGVVVLPARAEAAAASKRAKVIVSFIHLPQVDLNLYNRGVHCNNPVYWRAGHRGRIPRGFWRTRRRRWRTHRPPRQGIDNTFPCCADCGKAGGIDWEPRRCSYAAFHAFWPAAARTARFTAALTSCTLYSFLLRGFAP